MRKLLFLISCIILLFPAVAFGQTGEQQVKAAFIRNGHLWLKIGNKAEQISAEPAKYYHSPKWSHDGQWLTYEKESKEPINPNLENQSDIWVYNLKSGKHRLIFRNGGNAKWSPIDNRIAFTAGGVLNVSDLNQFYNVALGVDDFNWYPDGKSLLASSSAVPRPDGWTSPVLYRVALPENMKDVKLNENAKRLFIIPKEIGNGNATIMSINATTFEFSPDGKWISFIVKPTASLSMDSDMVCVMRADGKNFKVLDEMILHLDVPKWAPSENLLGYIAGGGRIVFGFKNKNLKVTELPAYRTLNLTPRRFAEMGFTWVDNRTLIVSRVVESEWSNDPQKRPEPALCIVRLDTPHQTRVTYPKPSIGDYHPLYLKQADKITWIRKKIAQEDGDIWMADSSGKNAKRWAKGVESYSFYIN